MPLFKWLLSQQETLLTQYPICTVDPDGDSEMLSSSESGSISGTRTPTEPRDRYVPASELSPPGSQEAPATQTGVAHSTNSPPMSVFDKPSESKIIETDSTKQSKHMLNDQPGASWKNQRAQEEYERAWDQVLDKDFNLGTST